MADVASNESAAAAEALTCEYAEPDPTSSLVSEATPADTSEATSEAASEVTTVSTSPLPPSLAPPGSPTPDTDAIDASGASSSTAVTAKSGKDKKKKPVTLLSLILACVGFVQYDPVAVAVAIVCIITKSWGALVLFALCSTKSLNGWFYPEEEDATAKDAAGKKKKSTKDGAKGKDGGSSSPEKRSVASSSLTQPRDKAKINDSRPNKKKKK